MRSVGVTLLVAAAIGLPVVGSVEAQGQRLYKYTDRDGRTQYTDKVPPEYADRDRAVLNEQGVAVAFEEGSITEEERLAAAAREAQEKADREARLEIARRDRMLLETYITVGDIEDLRDRRLELLESQIKVTELYLNNLRKRLVALQNEASRFKPYSLKEDAPQIPEDLARDISRTTASIALYEQTLARTRADQAALKDSFDEDIARFRQLKGG